MRRIAAAVLALALLGWCGGGAHTQRCEEDQACWNCHTMGNRVCGNG